MEAFSTTLVQSYVQILGVLSQLYCPYSFFAGLPYARIHEPTLAGRIIACNLDTQAKLD
jgi:hypothetical protein